MTYSYTQSKELWRQRISISKKGYKHSKETRKKMSLSKMGNTNTLGYRPSLETIEKLRQSGLRSYQNGRQVPHGKNGYRKDLGHNCRSTWEANFARVLKYLEIKYEYEPERFNLGNMTYLPDFHLPDLDIWVEVKGYDNPLSQLKRKVVKKLYGINLRVLNKRKYIILTQTYENIISYWEIPQHTVVEFAKIA